MVSYGAGSNPEELDGMRAKQEYYLSILYICYFLFMLFIYLSCVDEGNVEVKLPTIWTIGKAEVGRVGEDKRRREKIREEKE